MSIVVQVAGQWLHVCLWRSHCTLDGVMMFCFAQYLQQYAFTKARRALDLLAAMVFTMVCCGLELHGDGAGWNLPYSHGAFAMEIMFLILYVVVEFPRLQLGSSGNKAEKLAHVILMIAISPAVLLFLAYYTSWQMYVYVPWQRLFQFIKNTKHYRGHT